MLLKTKELCVLMIMVGTRDVSANQNTTRLVPAPTNKAKELLVGVNIKNVVKSVPDTTTPPAISRPDTSKTEAVRAVPVLSIRLNAILIHQTPELMLIVALQAVAERAVKMIPELITQNVPARQCMNGARQPKNASAQRGINILVLGRDIPAARATAVITNIKNANALVDTHGTRRPELVFAAVATNTPARVAISPADRVRLVAENIPPANAQPVLLGTHQAECAFVMALTGVRSIKTALV